MFITWRCVKSCETCRPASAYLRQQQPSPPGPLLCSPIQPTHAPVMAPLQHNNMEAWKCIQRDNIINLDGTLKWRVKWQLFKERGISEAWQSGEKTLDMWANCVLKHCLSLETFIPNFVAFLASLGIVIII